MAIKLNKQKRQFLVGFSGLVLGLYMMFVLNNIRGLIPFSLGVGVLLWRF